MIKKIKEFKENYIYEWQACDFVSWGLVLAFALTLLIVNSLTAEAAVEPKTIETMYGEAWTVNVTYYTGKEEGEWIGSHDEKLQKGFCAYAPDAYGKTVYLYTISPKGSKVILGKYEVRDTGASRYFSNDKGANGDRSARLDLWFECEEDAKSKFKLWADLVRTEVDELEIYMVLVDEDEKEIKQCKK